MKKDIQTLQVIHLALCVGVSLFAAMSIFQNQQDTNFSFNESNEVTLLIVSLIVGAAGIFIARFFSQKVWSTIKRESKDIDKMATYKIGAIIEWALIEAPALLAIVFFFIHANYLFLFIGIAILLVLFSKKPTINKAREITKIAQKEFE